MVYGFLAAAAVLVMAGLKYFGVVPQARAIVQATRAATQVMAATDIGLDDKERAVQRAALAMFAASARISLKLIATLAAPVACVYAGLALGAFGESELWQAAMGWPFLVGSSAVMVLIWRYL